MKNKPLDIVHCKNCKTFYSRQVGKDSTLYGCKKDSNLFDYVEPELYCHKQCFNKKLFK